MIMPNELSAYSSEMSGLELKETVRNLWKASREASSPLTAALCQWSVVFLWRSRKQRMVIPLSKVTKNGKAVQDDDTFTVTCLAIPQHMEAYPADETIVFDGADSTVKDTWTGYISDGDAVLAEPEDYITLR